MLTTAAIIVVAAAVAVGLILIGSPADQRARRIDERRLADLRELARAVDLYWTRHARLPASLDELSREEAVLLAIPADPETGHTYRYETMGASAYRLCAEFATAGPEPVRGETFWRHAAGPQCFELRARRVESY